MHRLTVEVKVATRHAGWKMRDVLEVITGRLPDCWRNEAVLNRRDKIVAYRMVCIYASTCSETIVALARRIELDGRFTLMLVLECKEQSL